MIKAILFDLDDTLIGNEDDIFMPPLLKALSAKMSPLIAPEQCIAALHKSTQAMIANVDPNRTNADVFADAFEHETGLARDIVRQKIDDFYQNEFSAMQAFTEKREIARPLIEYCFAQGYKVAIATNPMYPASAVEQRLDWAGVPVTEFAYSMVTNMDNTHATKPNAAYYREIMAKIEVDPWEAIMVGNSWTNDIAPADKLHFSTYWVAPDNAPAPAPMKATSRGSIEKLYDCCLSGWLGSL